MIIKTDTPTRITVRPAVTPIKADSEGGKENAKDARKQPAAAAGGGSSTTSRRGTDDYLDRNTIELPAEDRSNRPRHRLDEMLAEEGVDEVYNPNGAEEVRHERRNVEEREYRERTAPRQEPRAYQPRSIESPRGGSGREYSRRDEGRREEPRSRREESEPLPSYNDMKRGGYDRGDAREDRRYDDREYREDRGSRDARDDRRPRDDRDYDDRRTYDDRDYDDRYGGRDDGRGPASPRRDQGGRGPRINRLESEMHASEAPVGQEAQGYSPQQYDRSPERMTERDVEPRSLDVVKGKASAEGYASASGGQDEVEGKEYPMVAPSASSAAAAGGGGSSIPDDENPIYFDTADPEALLNFVSSPAPEVSGKIKCEIKRDKKGIGKGSYPEYYLRLERPNAKDPSKTDKVFLLAGRKRKKSKGANYIISVDAMDLSRDSESFVAKLRSNFVGTSFTVFDNGENLKKKTLDDGEQYRRELGAIKYETNILGYKGPRKMTVIIPAMDSTHQPMEFRPLRPMDQLLEREKEGRMDDLVQMTNKSPSWSEDSMSYVLNFGGRVTMASVKNFQIVHAKDPDYVVLQFGRVAEHLFTMDYQYPMSAIQAFAICLSSLESKLACE